MRNLRLCSTEPADRVVALLGGGLLALFFLYPPIAMLFSSGAGWERVLSDLGTYRAIGVSLVVATTTAVGTVVAGGVLAWLVVRTDVAVKRVIEALVLIAFVVPPYIFAIAWLQCAGPNGYIARFQWFFGVERGAAWYPARYSTVAVVVVLILHLFPVVYMALKEAIRRIDPHYEYAALLAGASRRYTIRTVLIPLVVPAIGSVGIFIFSRAVANFSVPALLALPVRIEVVTTRIYASLSRLQISNAAVLSVILVIISTSVALLYAYVTRNTSGLPSVRPSGAVVYPLGHLRPVVSVLAVVVLVVAVGIPLLAMVASSFLGRWGLPLRREYLTLANYRRLLQLDGPAARALWNSIRYGVGASCGAMAIVVGIIFLSTGKSRVSAVMGATIGTWPMAFPNVVLAVAAVLAWNNPVVSLYGTPWVIIVTFMVLFTPIILKQAKGLTIPTHEPLVAARLAGAGRVRSFVDVVIPAIMPGLKAGFLITTIIALREIPITLMLYTAGQETVGVMLFGMKSEEYGLEMTSALSVLLVGVILALRVVLRGGRKAGG